jgi:hypothetical protein
MVIATIYSTLFTPRLLLSPPTEMRSSFEMQKNGWSRGAGACSNQEDPQLRNFEWKIKWNTLYCA